MLKNICFSLLNEAVIRALDQNGFENVRVKIVRVHVFAAPKRQLQTARSRGTL